MIEKLKNENPARVANGRGHPPSKENATTEGLRSGNGWALQMFLAACGRRLLFKNENPARAPKKSPVGVTGLSTAISMHNGGWVHIPPSGIRPNPQSGVVPVADSGPSGMLLFAQTRTPPEFRIGGVSGTLILSTAGSAKITGDFGALNEGSTWATH